MKIYICLYFPDIKFPWGMCMFHSVYNFGGTFPSPPITIPAKQRRAMATSGPKNPDRM